MSYIVSHHGEILTLSDARVFADGCQIHCPTCDGYGFHRLPCSLSQRETDFAEGIEIAKRESAFRSSTPVRRAP